MPVPSSKLVGAKLNFQKCLRSWYQLNHRKLPWREAPSVYKTVVSEFMLQQTQVKTVLPYFHAWLTALPDFTALATASHEKVLKLWEGLGYYSRARNLHLVAKALVAQGTMPTQPGDWIRLPGIGPYTAAAVTSISFGVPVACVDGNVVRILTRLTADNRLFANSGTAAKELAPLANELVPRKDPGTHNQAMMELGATICIKAKPLCSRCPVLRFCVAGQRGDAGSLPLLAGKKIEKIETTRIWCKSNGHLLLHRAGPGSRRLANQHELPTAQILGVDPKALAAKDLIMTRKRGITRYRITESIVNYRADFHSRRRWIAHPELVWVSLGDLSKIVLSGPHRKWISELLDDGNDNVDIRQSLGSQIKWAP